MPLPTGGPWPPAQTLATADRLDFWSAWYSGDPFELERVHGASGVPIADNPAAPPGWPREQWQPLNAGSAAGAPYRRTFWGSPVPEGEQRMKLHIPAGGDIAAISADLLFAEPPGLTGGNDRATARLQEYEDAGLWTDMREAAEVCAALGGGYLRVVWDGDIAARPWLTSVQADTAVPEWAWNRLTAVTFWRVIACDGAKIIRHLERHEPGVILHGAYAGTVDKLGEKVSLRAFPETVGYVGKEAGQEGVIPTGTDALTVAYVPNVRPNRIWRKVPAAVNLGRSDFSGVEPMMDALDETWSAWMRDIRLAKLRIIVDQEALESRGKGKGALFDTDREVFVGMNLGPAGDAPITANQFEIRAAQHEQTAKALFEQIVRSSGYSVGTLSGAGEGVITATEVNSREKRSTVTRGRKVSYWRASLSGALGALLAVDNAKFRAGVDETPPAVSFPEQVFVDPMALATSVKMLSDAGAISARTKVEMVHPKWTKEQIDREVADLSPVRPSPGVAPEVTPTE